MNEKALNGTTEPAHATVQLRRTIIPHGIGQKIIYTTATGDYLGCLTQESMNQDTLKLMVNDYQAFVAQATGGLMVATGPLPKTQ
jgi:hypothetical protein